MIAFADVDARRICITRSFQAGAILHLKMKNLLPTSNIFLAFCSAWRLVYITCPAGTVLFYILYSGVAVVLELAQTLTPDATELIDAL